MSTVRKPNPERCERCGGTGDIPTEAYSARCHHFGNDPGCSCWQTCPACDGEGLVHDWTAYDPTLPGEEVCETCGAWRRKESRR